MENTKPTLAFCLLACFLVFNNTTINSQSLENFFQKGGKLYAVNIEYVRNLKAEKHITMYSIRIGYGSFLLKNFALHGSLDLSKTNGYLKTRPNPLSEKLEANGFGIGTSFILRWYALSVGPVSLFFDTSGGILYTFNSFPPEGTKLNFTARPGGGIAFQNNNTQFLLSVSRFHLSNGQGFKNPINPTYDGVGIFMGIIFRSKQNRR